MSDKPTYGGRFPQAWETIGRLTSFWATFESKLYQLCRKCAATEPWRGEDDVTMILINGLRYSDMTTALSRIARAKKAPKEALQALAEIVTEGAKVKVIRDLVAHRQFTLSNDEHVTFTFELWNRRSKTAPTEVRYTRAEIDLCASYAKTLASRVTDELSPMMWGQKPRVSEETLLAWRQKPSLPKPPQEDLTRTRAEWSPQLHS